METTKEINGMLEELKLNQNEIFKTFPGFSGDPRLDAPQRGDFRVNIEANLKKGETVEDMLHGLGKLINFLIGKLEKENEDRLSLWIPIADITVKKY
jgi:hypothetical protein